MIQYFPPLFIFIATIAVVTHCRAELSPESYAKLQREAPESLTVHVLAVNMRSVKNPDSTVHHVYATARVVDVQKTTKGVRVGQIILIQYQRTDYKVAPIGPGEIPLLQVGKKHPAFLHSHTDGVSFAPAARSYSFDRRTTRVSPDAT